MRRESTRVALCVMGLEFGSLTGSNDAVDCRHIIWDWRLRAESSPPMHSMR
jgi:hypothetical protein